MTEQVIIEFIPDFTKLDSGLDAVAKTGKVDVSAFKDIQKSIDATANDAKGLVKTFKDVAGASIKMGQSVENAFASGVQDALDEAGVSVEDFAEALKNANKPVVSLESQLRRLKDDLARLKVEGKDTGKEFETLRNRAGKLSDAIAGANAEIKNAGSDTRNIDNVVGSISALAGGYSAVQGAIGLFGEENENLNKTLLKVNSAMALAQGAQILYNATLKEGALTKLADSVATGAQTAAMTLLTFVTNGATVAARAYRTALLLTGIGAIVVLVVSLVKAFSDHNEKVRDAKKEIEGLEEAYSKLTGTITTYNNEAADIAQAQGKSESQVLKIRLAGLQKLIKANRELEDKKRKVVNETARDGKTTLALQESVAEVFREGLKLRSEERVLQEQINAAEKKEYQDRLKRLQDFAKKRKEALDKLRKETEAGQAEADKNFILGAIARANKEIEQEQIAFDNLQDIESDKREEYQKTLDAKKKALADGLLAGVEAGIKEVADVKKTEEEKRAEMVKTANTMIELASRVLGIYTALSDAQTARDQNLVAFQRKRIEEELKAGVLTQKQAEAKQKSLEKFEREARNRAAEREKKAAVFQAILAIPRAFLKGLEDGGIYLAAVYAALAAVEAGIIASKPVPRFFRGKKDRYEGPGEVADMGSEIVERGGRMFLYTRPTQTYLGANDKVYTAAETRQILHNTNASTTIVKDSPFQFDYDRFAKAIPESGININIDQDGIVVLANKAQSRTRYMDKRYSTK